MKHPNKKQQEAQANFLENLPEEEREEHARLFRFGNVSFRYHQRAEQMEPTETDFNEWLTGLPEPIRSDMQKRGFEACKGVISFTRYVMEKNDIGMDKWMENNLSYEDYKEYKKLIEERKKLDL
tara:strand:- start:6 stop:377 length:372 start_codon:yes stop_codon:yes gene_type:complete